MGGEIDRSTPGVEGWHEHRGRRFPLLSSTLTFSDRLGGWKARWGLGRMTYIVPPGLYAIGKPGEEDEVLVTCNYKMTYDLLRRELSGRNLWLVVLETNGINVWCAAGKGTFGTAEIVRRVKAVGLADVVTHRRLILPILGAPGVAAHEVKKQTGFQVDYGTIRAKDLHEYLDNGRKTTPAMKELTFTFYERLVLVPVEIVMSLKPVAVVSIILFAAATFLYQGQILAGAAAVAALWGAMLAGTLVTPVLLPFLPGPSFTVKGATVGLLWGALCSLALGRGLGPVGIAGMVIALSVTSGYFALNFTGCTPFTSKSGVKKELRLAMPAMIIGLFSGVALLVASRFI